MDWSQKIQTQARLSKNEVIQLAALIDLDPNYSAALEQFTVQIPARVLENLFWVLRNCKIQSSDSFLLKIVEILRYSPYETALQRNGLSVLVSQEIPHFLKEDIIGYCLDLVQKSYMPVAPIAFAFKLIRRFFPEYPEIREEVQFIVEKMKEEQRSPGIVSCFKKTEQMLIQYSNKSCP